MLHETVRRLLAAALALLALMAGACRLGAEGRGGCVRLALSRQPSTLDPALAEDQASIQVGELLFLGLTDFDDATMEVVPELATRWDVSGDGLVWTFRLRQGVRWVHYDPARRKLVRKRPVTAYDVECAVRRTLDPETGCPYAYVLYVIRNGQAFNTGRLSDASQVGCRALDDHTVEFRLERPAGYFPGIAGMWMARPVPREQVETLGEQWASPSHLWTNGPYALEGPPQAGTLAMAKNAYHYDARLVGIQGIHWRVVGEPPAALAMYVSGDLDACSVAPADLDRVRADPVLSRELHVAPHLSSTYVGINTSTPPFDNRLVRQAFSYAADRQRLIDAVLRGGQRPARAFAGPGVFGSPAPDPTFKGIAYDPDVARRLLAQAGYSDGVGLPEITLAFATHDDNVRVAEFLQRTWRDVLGVEVRLSSQEWRVFWRTVATDPPQLFYLDWQADYPDENNWVFQVFHSRLGANRVCWQSVEFDRAVEEAAASSDPVRRRELYTRAESLLCVEEAAIIPLFHATRLVCTRPYVERTYAPLGGEHVDRWKLRAR